MRDPKNRAEKLLIEFLDEQQLKEYRECRCITVRKWPWGVFKIDHEARLRRIKPWRTRYCVDPGRTIPIADQQLTFLLKLRHSFWRTWIKTGEKYRVAIILVPAIILAIVPEALSALHAYLR